MPSTFYSDFDLSNITVINPLSLENCVDNGSAPLSPNFSGSFSDVAYHKIQNERQFNRCAVSGSWTADINHSTPPSPINPNARIKKVIMRMQYVGQSQQSFIDAIFAGGDGAFTPTALASTSITLQVFPNPVNNPWVASSAIINLSNSQTVPGLNVSASSLLNPQGSLVHYTYDFTVNPNGDFPLGYMDYATFVTNFSQTFIALSSASSVDTPVLAYMSPPTATIDGDDSGNCFLQATNWTMEVQWELPSSWTLESSTITLPDNVVTITHPAVSGDEEIDERVEKIQIGDTIIEPNDPWVIIWTETEIKFHIPTDDKYDDPDLEIKLFFVGTEFSGAVSSIPLTIVYADLSGVYELDDSIYHDVLYKRTAIPTTQNVMIPAPFFVTHFVDTPEADVSHYAGTRMGITGQGTVKQVFQSVDYINTLRFGNVVLRTSNNRSPFSLANFTDQHACVRVYMDSLDDFMRVDQLIIFIKPVFMGYPQ